MTEEKSVLEQLSSDKWKVTPKDTGWTVKCLVCG